MKQSQVTQFKSRIKGRSLRSLPKISLSQTRVTTAFETDREKSEEILSAQIVKLKAIINECFNSRSDSTKNSRKESNEIVIQNDSSIRQKRYLAIEAPSPNPRELTQSTQQQQSTVKLDRRSRFQISKSNIQRNIETSDHVMFNQTFFQFDQYTPEKKKSEIKIKDRFTQNVKRSTNIISKCLLEEYNYLVTYFMGIEQKTHQLQPNDRYYEIQLPTSIEQYLPIKNLPHYGVQDLIEEIQDTLIHKSSLLKNHLYDVLKYLFRLLCDKVHFQTRSVNLIIQAYFIFCIVQESCGRVNEAIKTISYIDEILNVYQLLKPKIVLLNRMAVCLNRIGNYSASMMISKKQLQLCWYFNEKDYELKSYLNMYQTELARGNINNAQQLHERYLDHNVEKDGYAKQLGIKIIKVSIHRLIIAQLIGQQEIQEEFDLSLILKARSPKFNQDFFPKNHIQLNMVGDKLGGKGHPKIVKNLRVETTKKEYYKIGCIASTHFSHNRNYANFFNDRSPQNNNIQTIYRPDQSVPVILKLMAELKQNFTQLQTQSKLNES